MGDVLFYHLTRSPLSRVLPDLLERAQGRGWKAVVQTGDPARLSALDDMLWTYADDSFLPHGTREMGHVAAQPVFLTDRAENPNGAALLMLVDRARFQPGMATAHERVCLFFDGHDPDAMAAAREDWLLVKGSETQAVYWSEESGKWTEKVRS